jgi:hypothetical protein
MRLWCRRQLGPNVAGGGWLCRLQTWRPEWGRMGKHSGAAASRRLRLAACPAQTCWQASRRVAAGAGFASGSHIWRCLQAGAAAPAVVQVGLQRWGAGGELRAPRVPPPCAATRQLAGAGLIGSPAGSLPGRYAAPHAGAWHAAAGIVALHAARAHSQGRASQLRAASGISQMKALVEVQTSASLRRRARMQTRLSGSWHLAARLQSMPAARCHEDQQHRRQAPC